MKRLIFRLLIVGYCFSMVHLAITTPLTPHEAKVIYTHPIFSSLFLWLHSFGEGFFFVRLPSMLAGLIATVIYWKISAYYLPRQSDRYLALAIFLLLPVIVAAFVLVNVGVWMLLATLIYVWGYHRNDIRLMVFALLSAFFIDDSAIVLYVSIVAMGLFERDKRAIITALPFLLASIVLSRWIEIGGKPSGHFLEAFGLYATILSPLLFIYFFYVMYRIFLRETKSVLWYIGFTAFVFSLLLSLRQRILITDFAPFVTVSIPLVVQMFMKSYRVRLPRFRALYKAAFNAVVFFLTLSFLVVVTHRYSYEWSGRHPKHFAHKLYSHYESAHTMLQNATCFELGDSSYRYLYKFYGVKPCHR